ncbi:MAG: ABC transporter ATP-binding protein [Rhodobacteraceae bacterium]|nr:ABC transporter ATP-binding protein [Paracoccaceae bacterium]
MFRLFENLVDPYCRYPQNHRPPRRLWPFMLEYARPFRRVFWLAGGVSVAVAVVEIGLIAYMGRVIDLLKGAPAEMWRAHWVEFLLAALFVVLVRPAVQAVDVLLLNHAILPNVTTMMRWRAHRHVLRQSVGWFENDFAGRIANRVMQAPPAAGEAVYQIFDSITFSLAYMVGAAILLQQIDVRLVLPLLVWFVLYLALVVWTTKRVGPASKRASDARSEITGRVVDAYTNIHSVKLFAHHAHEITYAKEAIEHARLRVQQEMRIYTTMDVVLVGLNGLLLLGVVGWAVWLWIAAEASVGMVAAAAALALRLNAMTGWIMWALTSFFREMGVVAEGMETIAQPIELVDAPNARPLRLTEGRIEIQNLVHHYGRPRGGIDGVTLCIERGEKVGLVGRSGAGKSTLLRLLLRFYDAESGRILIDGQDIGQVTQSSLRSTIGMVQQDTALLHRSLRENILYGRAGASEAEMIAAAHKAAAHEFISELQDPQGRRGYAAHVGERGVKLSGGQRQRVALARVILKDAPILLLDEATAALDSEVEAIIQRTLYGMMRGKTVIAIAHRLSTIARMDRIVVMDAGRIVEQGRHKALLDKGGLYARLWRHQSGGFLDLEAAERAGLAP